MITITLINNEIRLDIEVSEQITDEKLDKIFDEVKKLWQTET